MSKHVIMSLVLLAVASGSVARGATTFFFDANANYFSAADTPAGFLCQTCDRCVHRLEDFEDGTLDLPLTFNTHGRIIGPGYGSGEPNLNDSVDGDDHIIDGTGQSDPAHGFSWFDPFNMITITFAQPVTSAGFAWTDGDRLMTSFTLEAFGPGGVSLGSITGGRLSDDSYQGTTAEDRFLGVKDPRGITMLKFTSVGGRGIEIDHIQTEDCSQCVPEPAGIALGLSLAGVLGGLVRRRVG